MTLQEFINSKPKGLDFAAGIDPLRANAGSVTMGQLMGSPVPEDGTYAAPVTQDQTKAYEDKAAGYYNITGITDPTKRDAKYANTGNLYDQLNKSGVNWQVENGDYDAYRVATLLDRQGVKSMSDLTYGANGEIINKATGKPLELRDAKKNRLDFTAAGKGHVNYVFHKDARGNPVLVPEWETSKTNLGVVGQLAPLAASLIPGVGAIAAPIVGGLTSIIQGGNIGDILKNAAIGYGAGQLGGALTGAVPSTGVAAIDNAIRGGITGGIRGGIQGDVLGGVTQGAIGGGVSGLSNSAAGEFAKAGVPDYIIKAGTNAALTYLRTGNPMLALQAAGKGAVSSGQGLQGIGGKVDTIGSLIPGGETEFESGMFDDAQGGSMDDNYDAYDFQSLGGSDNYDAYDFQNLGGDINYDPYDFQGSNGVGDYENAPSDWWLQEEANANPEVPSDSYWGNETGQPTPGDDQPPAGNPVGLPGLPGAGGSAGMPQWLKNLIGVGGSAVNGLTSGAGIAALLGALAQYAGRQKPSGGGTTRGYQSLPAKNYAISQGKYGPVRLAQGGIAGGIGMFEPKMGGITELAQGRMVRGPGDGVSDSIPAMIDGQQPAAIASEEYIIPARVVSELGNGSSSAGAKQLDAMVKRIQMERRGASNVAANTQATRHMPA